MKKKKEQRKQDYKRICIVRSNPVKPDSRVEKEAEALKSAGYYVHILAWDRESSHKAETSRIHNGIPITRLGYKSGYGEGLKNLRSRAGFQAAMFFWLLKNGSKFYIVHACDIDTGFFSYIPARLTGCRFVFDLFDFICGEPHNIFEWMVRKAQLMLVNRSDAVIICSEQRKIQIRDARPRKLAVIHNSPDESMAGDTVPVTVKKNRLSVVYVGILPKDRLLGEMISYFKKHSDQDVYIGGFGPMEEDIKRASGRYPNIYFVGRIPYAQTLALEKECDLMVAAYDPKVENYRMAAPNKFYESLMLGKPIIMVKGTGMSDVVEKYDTGVLIDYSEEGFLEGISKMLERKNEWEIMSQRMKELYKRKYSWQTMKKKLTDLYFYL